MTLSMKNKLLLPLLAASVSCIIVAIAPPARAGESPLQEETVTGPLSPDQVPEPLKGWVDWALQGRSEGLCPFLNGLGDEHVCAWGSPLVLSLGDTSGTFAQQWRLFADGFVPLPGDEDRWPIAVTSDRQPAAVVAIDGVPSVFLKRGDHAVSGAFAWDALPESLPIPNATGVIALSLKGAPVPLPNRDAEGLLWLGREGLSDESGESLQIRVSRLMSDGVPFVLTTHIDLDVSGKSREVSLGDLLPGGFIPMQLKSQVPARLGPEGALRVQLRPGSWGLDIIARHAGPVTELAFPSNEKADGGAVALPDEEVWAYEAHRDFRVATVEGAVSVDPQQTMVPDGWKGFPAYRMAKGETIRFVESMRGDTGVAPDDIRLARNLWLDFDGGGYTLSDRLTGQIKKRWRMEMNPPVMLGHVSSSGSDLLITDIPGSDRQGVELRHGTLSLLADSRIDGRRFSLPAIGWETDMQRVATTLHIGPGWRLFAVMGADRVPTAWLNQWDLLNIFLVLILSLTFAKLWGMRWGIAALVGFVLVFPESGAPRWSWCVALALTAIARLSLSGWLKTAVSWGRIAALAALVIIAVPFAVTQVRTALYPSTERASIGGETPVSELLAPPAPMAIPEEAAPTEDEELSFRAEGRADVKAAPPEVGSLLVQKAKRLPGKASSYGLIPQQMPQQMLLNIPNAKVQTGPGIPRWSWSQHEIAWSGPVDAKQKLRLFLIPPWLNFALFFLRVAALAVLALCAIGFPGAFWPPWMRRHIIPGAAAGLIACLACLLLPAAAAAAEFPPPEILDDLAARLTAAPECSPHCADIPRLRVEAQAGTLRLHVEVDAAGKTAVPLPGFSPSWSPSRVSVDGRPFAAMSRGEDGLVWLEASPGVHRVIIEGSAAGLQRVTIPLPLSPRRVEASLSGWAMEGLRENGRADGNLELIRTEKSAEGADRTGWASELPPFASVEREISLGLDWRVKTRVGRMTPPGSAVILEVPLIDGEAVTSAGITVKDGRALVSMAPQAMELSWESTLASVPTLVLTAPEVQNWTEVWKLNASPIWHVEMEGIPAIHQQESSGLWLPEWHPWPGETVSLAISQPEAVPGQTLTIDESRLILTPGIRSTEAELHFSARSSLGGQHAVLLPKGAELKSVEIDGVDQPMRQTERSVVLPIVPGTQRFVIRWLEAGGLSILFRTPGVDLGAPHVNSTIKIATPHDRWIFFLGGPKRGPAVLVWGLVVILAMLSWGLTRSGAAPLKAHQWFLLGLGLTQASVAAAAVVFGWFLILEWRRRRPMARPLAFDLMQILLLLWSMAALGMFIASLYQGLLAVPDMQIAGNGSTATELNWFVDRSPATLPRPWVASLPLFGYRIAMLGWAIWLALAFIGWIRWAWRCFSSEGTWKRMRTIVKAS